MKSAVSLDGSILSGTLSKHPKFEGVFRISQARIDTGHDEFGAWKDCLRRNESIRSIRWNTELGILIEANWLLQLLKGPGRESDRPGSRVLYLGAASGTTANLLR